MHDYYERITGIEYNVLRTDVSNPSVKEREKYCKVVRTALEEAFPNANVLVTHTDDPERIHFITDGTVNADQWVQEYGHTEVRSIGRVAWEEQLEEDKKNASACERL
ncbi:MAG: hypothetical protein MI749_08830 [Desulfovibrionales bacterium]|nr:hypothetical protein [Desulfovibrionales bacterium]